MRAHSGGVIAFPPDLRGMLGAAALLRRLGPDHDLLALGPHEVARRLYGLSSEPVPRRVHVVDLVPVDSVDTLLVPALHRLAAAGPRVTWIHGGDEPSALLEGMGDLIDLWTGREESWRLIADASGDLAFAELAEAVEARTEGPGTMWRMVLEAVSSSWDWCRIYTAVGKLARLDAADAEERAWAVEQITEVDRALAALERAPVREAGELRVAVLDDSARSARVRPEALQGGRTDVDAIAFVAGPGRLRLLAATPQADLSLLEGIPGLAEDLQAGAVSGSITAPRVELSWRPGDEPPAPIGALIDLTVLQGAMVDDGARIRRPPISRRAKGADPTRLTTQDRELIREALGPPGAGEPAGRDDRDPATEAHPSAHRTGIEIEAALIHPPVA